MVFLYLWLAFYTLKHLKKTIFAIDEKLKVLNINFFIGTKYIFERGQFIVNNTGIISVNPLYTDLENVCASRFNDKCKMVKLTYYIGFLI